MEGCAAPAEAQAGGEGGGGGEIWARERGTGSQTLWMRVTGVGGYASGGEGARIG